MNRQEFKNVKIGDILTITTNGRNKGKQGVVEKIQKGEFLGGGQIHLRPFNCEFVFSAQNNSLHTRTRGLYSWGHEFLSYPKEQSKKKFYIARMFGLDGESWSTDNFTEKELNVIERFIKEFNEHGSGLSIDCIAILEDDEDDEE